MLEELQGWINSSEGICSFGGWEVIALPFHYYSISVVIAFSPPLSLHCLPLTCYLALICTVQRYIHHRLP